MCIGGGAKMLSPLMSASSGVTIRSLERGTDGKLLSGAFVRKWQNRGCCYCYPRTRQTDNSIECSLSLGNQMRNKHRTLWEVADSSNKGNEQRNRRAKISVCKQESELSCSSLSTGSNFQRRETFARQLKAESERLRRKGVAQVRQSEYYDHSLYGLDADLDQAVGRHQRAAMLYSQETDDDDDDDDAGRQQNGQQQQSSIINNVIDVQTDDLNKDDDEVENEEKLHEQKYKQEHKNSKQHLHKHPHHHHHHRHYQHDHLKELIKADRSRRVPRIPVDPAADSSLAQKVIATAVDEEQLHQRFIASKSERTTTQPKAQSQTAPSPKQASNKSRTSIVNQGKSNSSSSSSSSGEGSTDGNVKSPPPAAIIIPASVAKSLSARSNSSLGNTSYSSTSESSTKNAQVSPSASITREQLEYGQLLRNGEVQVLYRSPHLDSNHNRTLKEEQARLVAPGGKQSPIAILSMNPTYQLVNKPLVIEYPATVDNLRLNNTGYSWEVKIPYQISMTTALYGAHLNSSYRYRLDQFHCHWGDQDENGSEHTVDNRSYSAEIHFVHYNMDKYHTMSKAARHPDGLVVLSVFLDAQKNHHNHAELEKVVNHLRSVPFKCEHTIIKQTFRIENLLPPNKSYWSYQGSLTTPPYYESVTWFVLKQPVKCSISQIQKFRNLSSALLSRDDSPTAHITSNHRITQPLNGRTIVTYDEASRQNNYR